MGSELVQRYAAALGARDWDAFAALLDDDVVYRLPQTGEVVRGREAFLRYNREFPGAWELTVLDAYGDERGGVLHGDYGVGESQIGVTVLRFAGDRVAEVVDYWPEPYEPPAGREHLTGR
ncbi:nuclear transport factor 2 family protein [Geodermatophilus normandii]|uniref:nuclear transport factor 2 family protein n=1 Tax=Geodermatophilus normandii TaxID=1137989 RepID=UPI0019531F78